MELVSTLRTASLILKVLVGVFIVTSVVGIFGFVEGVTVMIYMVLCLPGAFSAYFGSLAFRAMAQILENQEVLKPKAEVEASEE
jgi:hypothetical protein